MDMSQFHATFLEESTEHLASLEAGLLELEQKGATDMNAIFRAAHSIKGGAATFGFEEIAEFTHVVESVLERARSGALAPTVELTTALLVSLDIISELVNAAKENREPDTSKKEACLSTLNGFLGAKGAASSSTRAAATDAQTLEEDRVVRVTFKPKPYLLKTGSEPLSILRELAELGDAEITCHTDHVPTLDELEAEDLYLWWTVELVTDVTDEAIHDVFMFVESDADIELGVVASVDKPMTLEEKLEANELMATPMPERRQDDRRIGQDRRQPESKKEGTFIRVSIDKIDSLINMVGELVTTQAMVEQRGAQLDMDESQALVAALTQMASHTRNLQEAIMGIRMMPIDFAFSRFPRMVRDTASKLGKKVRLETSGAQTELDKTVIEKIADPLTHLVRNAIDHGIERPEIRIDAGKAEEGVVYLAAYYRGGNVIIEIQDDGAGLSRDKILAKAISQKLVDEAAAAAMSDDDVWQLIFRSGFSTADKVTDVSGRGVGMDVVRKNIQSLGGAIHIHSQKGRGSRFVISLPLTLAIVDGMAVEVGQEIYIVPILNIVESIRVSKSQVNTMQNGVEVVNIRGDYLPLLRLSEVFKVTSGVRNVDIAQGITVIAESDQARIALFVEDLLGERQVVIKSVEDNYRQIDGISGATILGDGRVAFIVDLSGLVKMARREGRFVKMPGETLKPKAAQEAQA